MPELVKPNWFGRNLSVLLNNGKTIRGSLEETGDTYIVLETQKGPVQVMSAAITLIRLADESPEQ